MTLVQRFAIGMFGVAALAAIGFVFTAPRTRAIASLGSMAPVAGVAAPVRAGTIDAAVLTAGPVVAITAHRGRVYLLQNHSWLRVDAGGVAGPFGSGVRGAAGVIASGAALVATDSCVYVLDRGARALLIYDPSGTWTRTISLRDGAFSELVPHALATDDRGRLLVSGYRGGPPGRWSITALHADRASDVYSHAGGPFDLLLPLSDERGHAYALSADYTLAELVGTRRFARRDPPRVRFPASARVIAGVPVPDFIPVVVHAFARSSGTFLVAIAASPDEVWVEEIDAAGRPLRTLVSKPVALPVGFSDSALYTLREAAQQTIVERHVLRAAP
jgi:hypothetical protein